MPIAHGSPVFLIERTSHTHAHRPVDFEQRYYLGDLIRFVTRLSRRARERSDPSGVRCDPMACPPYSP
ncbi:hypothetical protein [Burkholderia sp. IMCC1007]|uniref:hypothetical protein n=1 Tax=Burkholderia sp. IMCC1007 TaxID=3004104 RepID=UPI0022B3F054|nr:hypothetical protein [Burkholderia sp. IMCC1007]